MLPYIAYLDPMGYDISAAFFIRGGVPVAPWHRSLRQVGGVNCRNAFVSFKDRKSVELAKDGRWPWGHGHAARLGKNKKHSAKVGNISVLFLGIFGFAWRMSRAI